ncbi:rapid alkalinization factor-like [Silene latifolia]|uniref:rapid alkalinization factor-like n=1 Tax=Silene latifolia TaxID=37657 RepID=UPI003D77ECE8
MAKAKSIIVIIAVCLCIIGFIDNVHANDVNYSVSSLVLTRPLCNGSMAECLIGDELDELDSETHRRILATQTKYVSYGALNKNRVPCSKRGASYYNCKPGAQANPYSRGCTTISRCSRG